MAFPEAYLGSNGETTETGFELNLFYLPFSYE